jgi:hypothetical protein
MVARSGGHADIGDVVFHRGFRNHRLRAVSARHSDDVGGTNGPRGELAQIVAGTEEDGFDSSPARFVRKVERLHLPAAGLRVHDQDRFREAPIRSSVG